jgi:cell division GTPase FtsZ
MAEEGRIWSPYIKWSAIASGEGGGKIAALYFCTKRDEAIGDRVLLINTAKADLERTIREVGERVADKGEQASSLLDSIRREKIEQFGPPAGAGNFWKEGENAARDDFDKEELIRRRVETLQLGSGDAIFEITTLGGGTGCGSIPFIIDKMKGGGLGPLAEHKHFAVAAWPEMTEGGQRHFNAVCGLSRLLKFGEDGHQNADMVILVDNSLLSERIPKVGELAEKYFEMNKQIVEALGLMVAPGRGKSDVVIDVNDYVNFPSAIGVYHATPCLSLGNDIELIGLEAALDDALENPFFPMDPSTATMVWLVVRVPQRYYKRGEFEHDSLNTLFNKWVKEHIVGEVRYSAITYEDDAIMNNTFDVLLLLGGFKLDKLVPESYERYQKFRKVLESTASDDNIVLHGKADRVSLSVSELDLTENNLKRYIQHTEKVFEELCE